MNGSSSSPDRLDQLEQAWEQWLADPCGQPPDLAHYFAEGGPDAEEEAALLAALDMEYRWRARGLGLISGELGWCPIAEDYAGHYPQVRRPHLALILAEYETRLGVAGQAAEMLREELCRRYPELWEHLQPELDTIEEELRPKDGTTVFTRGCEHDPDSVAGLELPHQLGRYKFVGVIGRGGFAVVCQARDLELNRDVALKVLSKKYSQCEEGLLRFRNEATTIAQLRHHGITAVHEPVREHEGWYYFPMELVDGETLQKFLQRRAKGEPFERDLLQDFLRISETVASAHELGIINRDIKPENIVLGKHGRVRVLDWGLAKRLNESDTDLHLRNGRSHGPLTEDGQVLGSLFYMPPEQAQAAVENHDARCDVFGLGAILCEILTGKAPYRFMFEEIEASLREPDLQEREKKAHKELWMKVESEPGKCLEKAWLALDRSGAPRELRKLAKKCLALDPRERYQNAGEVAQEVGKYIASAERKERRLRRLFIGAAITGVVVVVVVGIVSWFLSRQYVEGVQLLGRVADLLKQKQYLEASAAADQASRLLAPWWVPQAKKDEVQRLRRDMEVAQRNRDFVQQSVELMSQRFSAKKEDQKTGTSAKEDEKSSVRAVCEDPKKLDEEFEKLFERLDLPDKDLESDEAIARMRKSSIRAEFVATLVHWAWVRGQYAPVRVPPTREPVVLSMPVDENNLPNSTPPPRDSPQVFMGRLDARLLRVAIKVAKDEPVWGDLLALLEKPTEENLRQLRELAAKGDASKLPEVQVLVARVLDWKGHKQAAIDFLLEAHQRHPPHRVDFWINFLLGDYYQELDPPQLDKAIGYYQLAEGQNPLHTELHIHLGSALQRKEDNNKAIGHFRKAVGLVPGHASAYSRARVRFFLGIALGRDGRLEEASDRLKEAVKLTPDWHEACYALSAVLFESGDPKQAAAEYRAVTLGPRWAPAGKPRPHARTNSSSENRDLEKEIKEHWEACVRQPNNALAWNNLGFLLSEMDRPREASHVFREALRCEKHAVYHNNLGISLAHINNLDEEAIFHLERAVQLDPTEVDFLEMLGLYLAAQGRLTDAIKIFQKAIELRPTSAEAWFYIAGAYAANGEVARAIGALEVVRQLKPEILTRPYPRGARRKHDGPLDALLSACRDEVRHRPQDAKAYVSLGNALTLKSDWAAAATAFQKAIDRDDRSAEAYFDLGMARYELRHWKESAQALRRACELRSYWFEAHYNMGLVHVRLGQLKEAEKAFRTAVRLQPHSVEANFELGDCLMELGAFDQAGAAYVRAIGSHSTVNAVACQRLAEVLRLRGCFADGLAVAQSALRLWPRKPEWDSGVSLMVREEVANRENRTGLLYVTGFRYVVNPWVANLIAQRVAVQALARTPPANAATGLFIAAITSVELASFDLPQEWRKCLELARRCEQLIELERRLAGVLRGDDQPVGFEELVGFAEVCLWTGSYELAAEFYQRAFAASPGAAHQEATPQPTWASGDHRHWADCAAILAGGRPGLDAAQLRDPKRTEWRRLGLARLREQLERIKGDMTEAEMFLALGTSLREPVLFCLGAGKMVSAREELRHLTHCPHLAGVREAENWARLPELEPREWEQFWDGAFGLLRRLDGHE